MEHVGFLGIIKLTKEIVFKNFKHFMCIAFIVAILSALELPVIDLSYFAVGVVAAVTSELYTLASPNLHPKTDPSFTQVPSSSEISPEENIPSSSALIASLIFFLLFPFLYNPFLAFSVCRACLNKSLNLKGALLSIPRSAKSIFITTMCAGALLLWYLATAIGTLMIVYALLAVGANLAATRPGLLMVAFGPFLGVVLLGGVYLAIMLSLANTVAILEEKRAWEAISRSMYLLAGRKWVALGLPCLFTSISICTEASVLWRWRGAGILRVGVQTFIIVVGTMSQVVLYMACKRYREEPLHTLIAARAQFGPPEPLPKSMHLEPPPPPPAPASFSI